MSQAQAATAAPSVAQPIARPMQPTSIARRRPISVWRTDRLTNIHAVAATLMAALGFAATWDAWKDIAHIAYIDEEYSHVFIVPLIAFVLVWIRRMRFRHCPPTGTIVGPIIAAIGWAATYFGFHYGVQSFWHGGAVMVVLGCAISILGKNVLFRFLPAVMVLVFLIPVPGTIRQTVSLPLQSWTAQMSQTVLETLGVNTEVHGNTLSINGAVVKIAEACNGMRGLFALILVSYGFSFSLPLRNSVRFIVLACSPLAAIFCNVLRTVPTIWLYGNPLLKWNWIEDPDTGLIIAEKFHSWAGWGMLPLSFLMLYGIIKLLKWAMIPVTRYPLASQESA